MRDICRFARIRPVPGRLEGVFDTPLPGYMKNLCRSAGNVFTPRKSPGPFASKESGLVFCYANVHNPRICLKMIRGITFLFGTYRKRFRVRWRNPFFQAITPAGNRAAYVPGWHALL